MTCCNLPAFPGRSALEQWGLRRCPLEQLPRLEPLVEQLSGTFTSERPEKFTIYLDYPDMLTAYALAFAPQTYVRCYEALIGILRRLPDFPKRPLRILDLGSGIGSAALAVKDVLAERTGLHPEITCVDWSAAALQAAKELLPEATILQSDLTAFQPRDTYDIILSSFAFNEAFPAPSAALAAIKTLLDALTLDAPSFVLLLEPADRIIVPKFHTLRGALQDFPLYAPCPHNKLCPMVATQDGVCHDVRSFKPERAMTLLCRNLRGTIAEVKYSLLAFGRKGGPEASGMNDPDFLRLVGPINKAKGLLTCRVCMGDGALRRLEIPSSALSTDRRHHLLNRKRGDCAWLSGALDVRKILQQGTIQRCADLHFTDEENIRLDEAMDTFSFTI